MQAVTIDCESTWPGLSTLHTDEANQQNFPPHLDEIK